MKFSLPVSLGWLQLGQWQLGRKIFSYVTNKQNPMPKRTWGINASVTNATAKASPTAIEGKHQSVALCGQDRRIVPLAYPMLRFGNGL
jgi:hypothetical protein